MVKYEVSHVYLVWVAEVFYNCLNCWLESAKNRQTAPRAGKMATRESCQTHLKITSDKYNGCESL